MKNIKLTLILISAVLLPFTGCDEDSSTGPDNIQTATGTITWQGDYAVDGCGFFIEIGGKQYKAENEEDIDNEFKSGMPLPVKISYIDLNKKISYTCGVTPFQEIDAIRVLSIKREGNIVVRKPNIYLYPEEDIFLNVKIDFPAGGNVTESIPLYDNGWNIGVSKEGKIDNEYSYLYYECSVPDLAQKEYGWVINKNNIKFFFENHLEEAGFNEKEIKDFIDYWIPLLTDFNYYEVYPQYLQDMEKMSVIKFSVIPENVFRLTYHIKGRNDNNLHLEAPATQKAKRTGFSVLEWGVIIKEE